jgi:hypothetical protein
MPSNFLFRVTRGLAVVVAIVVTHFVIVWLFNTMKIPVPDMGPVFATIIADPSVEADSAKPSESPAASEPGSASPPPPAKAANPASRKASTDPKRNTPAARSDSAAP